MRSARNVDPRADIWSIGAILYEMVSGKSPFVAESIPELCLAVIGNDPKPLRELDSDLPAGFEEVVKRCLEKDRERRYATVAELARALSMFVSAGTSSAERTGRILALSTAKADKISSRPQLATPSNALVSESAPPQSMSTVVAAASVTTRYRIFASPNVRLAAAGTLGLFLGALLWMTYSDESTAGASAPVPGAELRPAAPSLAAVGVPEPSERRANSATLDIAAGQRDTASDQVAPPEVVPLPNGDASSTRSSRLKSVSGGAARRAPIVAGAPASKPTPQASAAKPIDAWDPATFGGRY
jgi:eukaryotic-like serine/threonine-protein kinase